MAAPLIIKIFLSVLYCIVLLLKECSHGVLKRTGFTHLRDAGHIRLILELGDIVIDVLHRDDKLRLGLLRFIGPPVDRLGLKDVEGLFLTVELLQGPDIAGILIHFKHVPGALSR